MILLVLLPAFLLRLQLKGQLLELLAQLVFTRALDQVEAVQVSFLNVVMAFQPS